MKSGFLSALLSLIIMTSGIAQANFAEDIAPIIYKNCSNCHRAGEIGPMELTNYEQIRDWAPMIKQVTASKYMPPWKADPGYSNFIAETYLEQSEIDMIGEWVDNGMERGDLALEPDFPDYPSGSLLGEPDLVLTMEQAHLHKGNNQDSYYYFVLSTDFPEDKVIKAMEFRPGNTKIVHHALIFEDTQGIAKQRDAQTPEYGFEEFGSFRGSFNFDFREEKQFPAYAPGQKALRYPEGVGQVLHAGADLAIQIHYAPVPNDETDLSSVNIFFADEEEEIDRLIGQDLFLPDNLVTGFNSFFMLPNTIKEFVGVWTMEYDKSLVGIAPHSHLLGEEWEAWIEHTDGSRTNLISIPDWDFNWQGSFYFPKFIKAEKGSVIKARAVYDNTSLNPDNPSDPPTFVTWGEGTNDEMFYMPVLHVPYQDGDENIVFDDQTVSTEEINDNYHIFSISPNPVDDYVQVNFAMKKGGPVNMSIYDISGNLVRTLRDGEYFHTGTHTVHFNSSRLEAGAYIMKMSGKEFSVSQKFIKVD